VAEAVRRYTQEEAAEFVAAYESGGLDAACAVRPNLSRHTNLSRLARMGAIKVSSYQPWTTGDLNLLKIMCAEGFPHSRAARILGRSESSVTNQTSRSGITKKRSR
jgi:hypothetical protein